MPFDSDDELEARRMEIAENLHRAELTTLERSEQVAEWVRLTEERQGILRQLDAEIPRGRGQPEGGRRAASREINVSEPQARRAEHDENELRKDFTPSERVAIGLAIERELGERRGGDQSKRENFNEWSGRRTDEVAAEKSGFGNHNTYRATRRAREVCQQARRGAARGLNGIDPFRTHAEVPFCSFLSESSGGSSPHARRCPIAGQVQRCTWSRPHTRAEVPCGYLVTVVRSVTT